MRLFDLPKNQQATIVDVESVAPTDPIARRLHHLGFVGGEPVRVVAHGPMHRDPLLIQIGYTRFALRRSEAARIRVRTTNADGVQG